VKDLGLCTGVIIIYRELSLQVIGRDEVAFKYYCIILSIIVKHCDKIE